jgi:hypothetical protein
MNDHDPTKPEATLPGHPDPDAMPEPSDSGSPGDAAGAAPPWPPLPPPASEPYRSAATTAQEPRRPTAWRPLTKRKIGWIAAVAVAVGLVVGLSVGLTGSSPVSAAQPTTPATTPTSGSGPIGGSRPGGTRSNARRPIDRRRSP